MKYKLFTCLLFFFYLLPIQAQYDLKLKKKDQTQSEYSLSEIRKITFADGEMVIANRDNSVTQFMLSNIQNLTFMDNTSNVDDVQIGLNSELNVYPNPVQDYITITLPRNEDFNNCQFRLLNINGQLLITKKFDGSGILTVDVSMLSSGIYICQYYNGSRIQIKKFVKQ